MTPYLKPSNLTQYDYMKKEKSTSSKEIQDRKLFYNQKLSVETVKVKDEIPQFNDFNQNELQGSMKKQVSFARTWVKRHIVPSRDTTLSFCVLLIAYHHFCKENDQLPLKPADLLQILQSSFECADSSWSGDQSVKADECSQEHLSTPAELDDASSGDQTLQDDPRDFQNLQFKCDIIKIESSDEAYESDLSDSDMKEVSTNTSFTDCINSEERDSSYESLDETSNDAALLDSENGKRDFKVKSEITSFISVSTTNVSNGLDSPHTIEISAPRKVIQQTPGVFVGVKRQIDNDDRHNRLLPRPKKVKWSEEQKKVIVNMKGLLDFYLENYKGSVCYPQAKSLSETIVEMLQRKQIKYFLEEFGHAMSCGKKHGSLCFMFKRVVNHILKANHECALKNIYGHILRLHLDTCKEDQCGFPNCKIRREERAVKLQKQWEQKNASQVESN